MLRGGRLRLAAARQACRKTLAIALASATALSFVAQSSAQTQSNSSIKVTTRLVVLNVVVTDKANQPVIGLTREDFQILENDQAQTISSFEPTVSPSNAGNRPESAAGSSVFPGGAAPLLKGAESPRTILVLDELNTPSEDLMFAGEKMKQFLLKQPAELSQMTSIYLLTKRKLELFAPPTRDRKTLLAALQKDFIELPPHYLDSGGIQGGADRLIASLMALDQIALANAELKTRKNVIWIGHGIHILSDNSVSGSDRDRFRSWVHYTANWLQETQTTVYTIDPRGLEVTEETVSDGGNGMNIGGLGPTPAELVFESVAPESGGEMIRGRNDLDVAIATAVRDGSSYYALSYYPANRNWDGNFRKIRVTVTRPQVTARTQMGYYAFPDGMQADGERIDFALSRAVTSPVPFSNVAFTAKGTAGGGSGTEGKSSSKKAPVQKSSARVVLAIDRESLSWNPQENGDQRSEVTLVTSEISSSGKVLGYHVRELEVVVERSKWNAPAAGNPVQLAVSVEMPAKTDHIRLVLRDAETGHLGTFDLPTATLAAADVTSTNPAAKR